MEKDKTFFPQPSRKQVIIDSMEVPFVRCSIPSGLAINGGAWDEPILELGQCWRGNRLARHKSRLAYYRAPSVPCISEKFGWVRVSLQQPAITQGRASRASQREA